MEQKILCISGRKQSGKSSLSNFIHGYQMLKSGVIKNFDLSDNGELLNPAVFLDEAGVAQEGMGVLNLSRMDDEFIQYAQAAIWPQVKEYSFADRLKQALIIIFGVRHEQLYGSDEQKNTPINIQWSNFKSLLSEQKKIELDKVVVKENFLRQNRWNDFLTARDLAQVFGSDICRVIQNDCWINSCYQDIVTDGYPFVIIADARFPDELDFMKSKGAKLIRLTRNLFDDKHISETSLDNYPIEKYDLVVDNQNMTLKEKNQALLQYLLSIGWVTGLDS